MSPGCDRLPGEQGRQVSNKGRRFRAPASRGNTSFFEPLKSANEGGPFLTGRAFRHPSPLGTRLRLPPPPQETILRPPNSFAADAAMPLTTGPQLRAARAMARVDQETLAA